MTEQPQIYLITPATIDLDTYPDLLARVLDQTPVACLRLALAARDEDTLSRAADAVRETAHARDIAVVISDHLVLAQRLGLDGVHFSDAGRSVRTARQDLGQEAIIGSFCGTSRHDGMNAGEAGADYISFGPVGGGALGDGSVAEAELFDWWSQMIELPVVAEGGLTTDSLSQLAPITDFFGIGDEIWSTEDPAATLAALLRAMG